MNITLSAFQTSMKQQFDQHKTVAFSFQKEINLNLAQFLSRPAILPDNFKPAKSALQISLLDSNVYSSLRADLVVTDSPQDINAMIDMNFLAKNFKLVDIIAHASDVLDIEPQVLSTWSWQSIMDLTPEQRMRLLAQPIMKACQKNRQTEEQMLGYKRISWEAFSNEYSFFEQTAEIIVAIPKTQIKGLLFGSRWTHYLSGKQEGSAEIAVTYNDDKIWATTNKVFNSPLRASKDHETFDADNITGLVEWIESCGNYSDLHVWEGQPQIELYNKCPAFTKQVKINNYFPSGAFLLPALQNLARDLNIKGFSTKTKSELVILLGEYIADQPVVSVRE